MALETQQHQAARRTSPPEAATATNQLRVPWRARSLTVSAVFLLLLLTGCTSQKAQSKPVSLLTETQLKNNATSLAEARRGFQTVLLPQKQMRGAIRAVEQAPAKLFRTLKYPAPKGALAAYLSPDPGDGKKHPAVIWITGGDCNSINNLWSPEPRSNDQTAAALRQAGIVLMFPSLRGGNDNPGQKEGFFGEVDDVLAAANYLAKQPYVDPNRIYLGGHSTGGTLALLVAEVSNRFRAVFAFGPVADVSLYGNSNGLLPFDRSNRQEVELRSPGYWLASIQSPVWVFEGTEGNIEQLRRMAKVSTNPKAHFIELQDVGHFATLAPTNEIIAKKILQDTGVTSNLSFFPDEVNRVFARVPPSAQTVTQPPATKVPVRPAPKPATAKPLVLTKRVSRAAMGDRWPFTVAAGELRCLYPGALVFTTGGRSYALNGYAEAMGYEPEVHLRPLRQNDPTQPGGKKSLIPMHQVSADICLAVLEQQVKLEGQRHRQ